MFDSMKSRSMAESPVARDMETVIAVLERRWATPADLRRALQWRSDRTPRIGKLAMTCGKLTVAQVFEVLGRQAIVGGLFGEVAVEMGFLSHRNIHELVALQQSLTPGLADALAAIGKVSLEQAQLLAERRAVDRDEDGLNCSSFQQLDCDEAVVHRHQLN